MSEAEIIKGEESEARQRVIETSESHIGLLEEQMEELTELKVELKETIAELRKLMSKKIEHETKSSIVKSLSSQTTEYLKALSELYRTYMRAYEVYLNYAREHYKASMEIEKLKQFDEDDHQNILAELSKVFGVSIEDFEDSNNAQLTAGND